MALPITPDACVIQGAPMTNHTPTTDTVLECFLDGAAGEFISGDFTADREPGEWVHHQLTRIAEQADARQLVRDAIEGQVWAWLNRHDAPWSPSDEKVADLVSAITGALGFTDTRTEVDG